MTEVLEWILGAAILVNVLVAVYCTVMYRRRR